MPAGQLTCVSVCHMNVPFMFSSSNSNESRASLIQPCNSYFLALPGETQMATEGSANANGNENSRNIAPSKGGHSSPFKKHQPAPLTHWKGLLRHFKYTERYSQNTFFCQFLGYGERTVPIAHSPRRFHGTGADCSVWRRPRVGLNVSRLCFGLLAMGQGFGLDGVVGRAQRVLQPGWRSSHREKNVTPDHRP